MCLIATACGVGAGEPKTARQPERDSAVAKVSATTFSRASGGSATTKLGYGISVNPGSSLEREWITAHDTTMPAFLDSTVGIRTIYKSGGGYSSGEYQYVSSVRIKARDSVAAIEIRFVLFDIWGNFVKTLSDTEIEDIPGGSYRSFTPRWRIWDENEVSEHYASVAYISRIRTTAGKVYEADFEPILAEAQKISQRFTREDLEPNRRPRRDSSGTATDR